MTPEAVIDRYLESASREPFDPTEFALLLGADADLLSRWLQVLGCGADPTDVVGAVAALPSDRFHDLAVSHALSVLTVSDRARLAADRWRSMLRASVVGEVLAMELALAEPVAVRWRVLLAASGVQLTVDPVLTELLAFRGARAELLEDASAIHRVFAVVEALGATDPLRAQEVAHGLLRIDPERFRALLAIADRRCQELLGELGISDAEDADASERVWLRMQIALLGRLLPAGASARADLLEVHELICRRLFSRAPALFLLDEQSQRLVYLPGGGPDVSLTSSTSLLARSARDGVRLQLIDRADQPVADRQVLRHLASAGGECVPLVNGLGVVQGVLVFALDEEPASERAMALYAAELAKRLSRAAVGAPGGGDALERFRQRVDNRLREVVHEANNPLSIVNNYLHILEATLADEPEALQQLRLIGSELERAADIIGELRDLPPTDVEPVEPRVEFQAVDLNALARRVVELHSGYADEYQVHLAEHLVAGSLVVRSDEQRLAQILTNLLRNAIEAAQGASVTVSTVSGIYREGRQGTLLEVADTGPGLSPGVLERLAEPKETTKGGDHSGLGLHIVHRLVGEVAGSIDVRTTTGQGTTFTIFLPISPVAAGAP